MEQGNSAAAFKGPIEIVLPIEGMTCASCVNRIERYLNKTDGVVQANVNLATERATVTVDPSVTGRSELVAAVEAAGYDVRPETERRRRSRWIRTSRRGSENGVSS
jgi:Cu+-exporting ATPase